MGRHVGLTAVPLCPVSPTEADEPGTGSHQQKSVHLDDDLDHDASEPSISSARQAA